MPKCETCEPGTTPAIVQAGKGLSVSGVGTPTSPLKIELTDAGSILALQVRDSPTINFTITGSGSTDDPYVLTGDTGSATALTGLADYSSATPPTDGEVLMWSGSSAGGHWTAAPLPAPGLPVTDASKLTSGILSNSRLSGVMVDQLSGNPFTGDMNSLLSPGIFRIAPGWSNGPANAYAFGTLVVYAAGQSVTQHYYTHAAGESYYRTKWNASDWTPWLQVVTEGQESDTSNAAHQALSIAQELQGHESAWNAAAQQAAAATFSTGLAVSVVSGFTLKRNDSLVYGQVVNLDIDVQANQNLGSGNIVNMQVGYVAAGYGRASGQPGLHGGHDGPDISGYLYTNQIWISADDANINNGDTFSLSGTWIRS